MNELFDLYMKQRLLDIALGRRKCKSIAKVSFNEKDIEHISEHSFCVKSENQGNVSYKVDLRNGLCECFVGQSGAVCKHQIACAEVHLQQLPQVFKSTKENRYWLAGVAVGTENVPPLEFFSDLQDLGTSTDIIPEHVSSEASINDELISGSSEVESVSSEMDEVANVFEKDDSMQRSHINIAKEIFDVVNKKLSNFGNVDTSAGLSIMLKRFSAIKSTNQLNSMLFTCGGSSLKIQGAGRGKIPCQPTSVARRQVGMPRGAAPIGKGRKRKGILVSGPAKRQRKLSLNVSQNVPNAKSH